MSRIEVLPTNEIDVVNDVGNAYTVVEYSTIQITPNGNSAVHSYTASKSYKLLSGMYVNRTGMHSFEVVGSGMKLTRRG